MRACCNSSSSVSNSALERQTDHVTDIDPIVTEATCASTSHPHTRGERNTRMVEQTIAPVKKTNGTVRRWEPFDVFEAVQGDLERFWHRPFSLPMGPLPAFFQRTSAVPMTYVPRMDVYEKDGMLILKAELPGLKKEDVQVEIYNGNLIIKGE